MSNHWLNHVWKSNKHKGNARLVLLAIADHANEEGECWPSVLRIADHANISKRQAIRIIANLEADGSIGIQRGDGRNHTSIYKIKGDIAMSPLAKENSDITASPFVEEKGDISRIKGDIFDTKGDMAMSPEPLIEPPIEEKAAAEPPAFLPDTDADKDGRFTMQLLQDTNLFGYFRPDSRNRAIPLEETYSMEAIRKAVDVLVERHRAMLERTGRGVQEPISFLAKLLLDDFKTKAHSERVQVEMRIVPDMYDPNERIKYITMSRAEAIKGGYKIVGVLQ